MSYIYIYIYDISSLGVNWTDLEYDSMAGYLTRSYNFGVLKGRKFDNLKGSQSLLKRVTLHSWTYRTKYFFIHIFENDEVRPQ